MEIWARLFELIFGTKGDFILNLLSHNHLDSEQVKVI